MNFVLPAVLAHRGANTLAPENTLAAFRLAQELGARWIECDVMLSCDLVPVIFHDETVEAITNATGWVASKSLAELLSLEVQRRDAAPGIATQSIPTLAQLLQDLEVSELGVNLEVKANSLGDVLTCQRIIEVLQASGLLTTLVQQQRLLVSSFSRGAVVYLRQQVPQIPCAYLIDHYEADALSFARQQGCVSVNFWNQMTQAHEFLTEAHAAAMPTLCYTVNSLAEAHSWLEQGVRGIFSDNIDCYCLIDSDFASQ